MAELSSVKASIIADRTWIRIGSYESMCEAGPIYEACYEAYYEAWRSTIQESFHARNLAQKNALK